MDFTATWGWPQWTILISMVLSLIIQTALHGKERPDFNGFAAFVSFGISMFILICGGFFS